MGQTTLSVRMDSEVKKEFDAFCAEAGMNSSVAINLFARKVVREWRIPFEISAPRPNAETKAAMDELLSGGGTRCKDIAEMYKSMGIEQGRL